MKLTLKEKLHDFWINNWYGKILWLTHWTDTYEQHTLRYYKSKYYKRAMYRFVKALRQIDNAKIKNSLSTQGE